MTGDEAGVPHFRIVTAIVLDADADRLAAWCARTELTAELRQLIGALGHLAGWDQQQVLLGGMLVNALAILEAAEHRPREET